ncbi:ABC transporter permease [Galbitalea sp. SE-J8]|uniref:ABC transporter permease n=1 Tax=Galbitalea sp. SE-J8 TaxID=3054952 RepID=UPI00259D0A70|nr:ABC transporter permease [Galbitalea sp. SE-J8]MDM4762751.1 ABC transporter permease [Galbitalea sp. SE-J8]
MSVATVHRASWLAQTAQVFARWARGTIRQPWGLGMGLIQPLVWILLFGQVFRSIGDAIPGGYLAFLVPGVLMMTVLYTGAWAGTGFIDDIASGVLDQQLTSPIRRSALVVGQLLQQLALMLVQGVIVLAIGLAGGARFDGGPLGVLAALGASLLLATLFCCFSTAIALLTRNQIALISISQLIVLPATFLSTAMMPTALQPDWVAAVAAWNPLSWAVDLGRAALAGDPAPDGWGAQLAGLAIADAVLLLLAERALAAYNRSR